MGAGVATLPKSAYGQALARAQETYLAKVEACTASPQQFPLSFLNILVLICWLFLCHYVPAKLYHVARWAVLGTVLLLSTWNILYVRAVGVASISVGLNAALCTILAVNFVLLRDPRGFRRLRSVQSEDPSRWKNNDDEAKDSKKCKEATHNPGWRHAYESVPKSAWPRLWWTLDLITSLRGTLWTWRFDNDPSHRESKAIIGDIDLHRVSRVDVLRVASAKRSYSMRFIRDYLGLDVIKTIMISDTYFLGSSPPTASPLFSLYDFLTHTYHLLLIAIGIHLAIDILYTTIAVTSLHLFNLSSSSPSPATESAALSLHQLWGSPSAIAHSGLRGFWGKTWHQLFRAHFTTIGDAIASAVIPDRTTSYDRRNRVATRNDHRAKTRAAVRVAVAFLLSGALHAAGSHTLLGPTRPWAPLLFFALQPVGIAAQAVGAWVFDAVVGAGGGTTSSRRETTRRRQSSRKPTTTTTNTTKTTLRRFANCAFTLAWLWATFGLLADDFSRGGVWLFEPVPVSFARGLLGLFARLGLVGGAHGYGTYGDGSDAGWWCWG